VLVASIYWHDKIARFKKPKHVVFVSELPKAEDRTIARVKDQQG